MPELDGQLLSNINLANHSSWRVGGVARYAYKPESKQSLSELLSKLYKKLPIVWLGLGSNTLIRDGGFDGLVILTQSQLNELYYCEASDSIYAEAGVSCATLARFCARQGFSGGEFWAGIPGTVGGALRMNAGCFGGETWSYIDSVDVISSDGSISQRSKDSFNIGYRHVTGLGDDEWFIGARIRLPRGDKAEALSQIKAFLQKRNSSQPINTYSCGSVFRNPTGDFAARLIESSGLKGKCMGGAQVSEKHANFIVHHGEATSQNIEDLIACVSDTVLDKEGILLKPEVHILGDAKG